MYAIESVRLSIYYISCCFFLYLSDRRRKVVAVSLSILYFSLLFSIWQRFYINLHNTLLTSGGGVSPRGNAKVRPAIGSPYSCLYEVGTI